MSEHTPYAERAELAAGHAGAIISAYTKAFDALADLDQLLADAAADPAGVTEAVAAHLAQPTHPNQPDIPRLGCRDGDDLLLVASECRASVYAFHRALQHAIQEDTP